MAMMDNNAMLKLQHTGHDLVSESSRQEFNLSISMS